MGDGKSSSVSWSHFKEFFFLISLCFFPQEQIANGHTSVPSSSVLLIGSYNLDREVVKKLAIGLALAVAVLALIVEKLFWRSKSVLEEEWQHRSGQWHHKSPVSFNFYFLTNRKVEVKNTYSHYLLYCMFNQVFS